VHTQKASVSEVGDHFGVFEDRRVDDSDSAESENSSDSSESEYTMDWDMLVNMIVDGAGDGTGVARGDGSPSTGDGSRKGEQNERVAWALIIASTKNFEHGEGFSDVGSTARHTSSMMRRVFSWSSSS
jgi:hypothetical protein